MEVFWARLGIGVIIFACLGGIALIVDTAGKGK